MILVKNVVEFDLQTMQQFPCSIAASQQINMRQVCCVSDKGREVDDANQIRSLLIDFDVQSGIKTENIGPPHSLKQPSLIQ